MTDHEFDAELKGFIAQVRSLEAERDHLQAQNAVLRTGLEKISAYKRPMPNVETPIVWNVVLDHWALAYNTCAKIAADALAAAEKAKPE